MKFLTALKHYLEAEPHGRRATAAEMIAAKAIITDEDRAAWTPTLAAHVGEEIE